MNVPEYQAKALLHELGVPISRGAPVLPGLAVRRENETGMPILIAPNPLHAVAIGSGQCLEEFEVLKGVFINSNHPH